MVELSRFPLEVLDAITSLILASDVFALAYLSGDRLLRAKLIQGGAKVINFDTHSCSKIGFKFLADLKDLVRVSIEYTGGETLPLDEIPDSIRELRIVGSQKLWLEAPASSTFASNPKHRQLIRSGRSSYHFLRFKRLRKLFLESNENMLRGRNSRIDFLVARLLPATLEQLSISGLHHVPPYEFKRLPSGLEIIGVKQAVAGTWISEVRRHAPQIHFDHLLAGDFDPIFAAAPARTVSIEVYSLTLLDLPRFAVLFPKTGLPAPASTAYDPHQAPYLLSIRTHQWLWDPSKDLDMRNIAWPESLRVIEDVSTNGRTFPLDGNIPIQLKRLEYRLEGRAPLVLPESLTSLALRPDALRKLESDLLALPKSLTELSITKPATWKHAFSSLLPGSLKSLKLTCLMAPLTAEFFTTLPPLIETIIVDTDCSDTLLIHLPKTVTKFESRSLSLTGAVPFHSDSGKLTIVKTGIFNCNPSGKHTVSPREGRKNSMIALTFDGVPLPSHLTHLVISAPITDKTFKEPLLLPHLTRLDLKAMDKWNWKKSLMPSLTRLHVESDARSSVKALLCPPSITHVVLEGSLAGQFVPTSLCANLRILEVKCSLDLLTLAKLTSLETLSMLGHWHSVEIATEALAEHLPPSLRSLTLGALNVELVLRLSHLLAKLPLLRNLRTSHLCPALIDETLLDPRIPLETLTCPAIKIESIETFLRPESSVFHGDSFDMATFMVQQLQNFLPFLKLSNGQLVHLPALTRDYFTLLASSWSGVALTTMTFGTGVTLWSRFGKLLPRTLTKLDVLAAKGVDNATPWHLPSSITDLKISTRCFPSCAYQQLPRGIVSLQMTTFKLLNRHIRALPPNLEKLTVKCLNTGTKVLSLLPPSVTHIEWDCERINASDIFAQGLPPNIRILQTQRPIYGAMNTAPYPNLVILPDGMFEADPSSADIEAAVV